MPSTVVEHISYKPDEQELSVTFVSGEVYVYTKVPEKVYRDFKSAVSKGNFLNRIIKKKYKVKKSSSGV